MNASNKYKKTDELGQIPGFLGLSYMNETLKNEHPQYALQIQSVVEFLAFKLWYLQLIISAPTRTIEQTPEARAYYEKLGIDGPLGNSKYHYKVWEIMSKQDVDNLDFTEVRALSAKLKQEYLAKGYHWNRSRFNHYLEKAHTLFPEYLQGMRKMHLEQAFYDAGPRKYHIPESLGPKLYMRFMDMNDMYTIDEFEELFNALYADIQTELNLLDQFENNESPDVSWYVEYKRGYNEDDGDHYLESLITQPEFE